MYQESPEGFEVGIASPDVRLSDVQAHFDQVVQRIPSGNDLPDIQRFVKQLFHKDKPVYCLVLERDFISSFKTLTDVGYQVINTEPFLRRKMALDQGFLTGFLKFDRQIVDDYLMEKIYLVKKEK